MAEAYFTRTDTAEGARFDVTPAPKLGSQSALLGCISLIPLAIAFFAYRSGGMVILMVSGILWVPLLVLILVAVMKGRRHDRKPTSLLVNAEGIRVDGRNIAARDIAELILQLPGDHGGRYVEGASRATASQVGRAVAVADENRSYALMARLRSDSRPQMLVFGLTPNVGRALLDDVSAVLGLS